MSQPADLRSADGAVRRIGLLGGSFDPPHLAHRALGRLAQQTLALDELRWLPAGQPWQKAGQRLAEPAHRLAMLQALLDEAPGAGAECIDPRELQRQGPSYTIDTVLELRAEAAAAGRAVELFLIIGQDQYGRIDTWQRWPELLELVRLAVAAREGKMPCAPAALAERPGHHDPSRVHVLPLPRLDIAARDIRRRLAAGLAVDALVGPAVAGYIARHGLYRDPSDNDSPGTR
ncbi:MAG: nicotinate (nicotinamide) nucleotide adenylyltransferase [Pseudomonadota bacterium]